mmetsp:Transcript_29856/g.53070  ORF Transcript_29856/g.53070 Transcript_29856/m.53070 type:complete len:177 (-) Transcript_29856:24-554(-)
MALASSQDLVISELPLLAVGFIYKVIGCEQTLVSYNESIQARASRSQSNLEWKLLYTQCTQEHALGTVGYRWDQGYSEANLVHASLNFPASFHLLKLDGPMMYDGAITGEEKARAVKAALGWDAGTPLSQHMQERLTLILVPETEQEWELAIPHALVRDLIGTEEIIETYRRPKWL